MATATEPAAAATTMMDVDEEEDSKMPAMDTAAATTSIRSNFEEHEKEKCKALLRCMKLNDSEIDLALLDRIENWIQQRPRYGEEAPANNDENGTKLPTTTDTLGATTTTTTAATPGVVDTAAGSSSSLHKTDDPNVPSLKKQPPPKRRPSNMIANDIMELIASSLLLQRLIRSFQERNGPTTRRKPDNNDNTTNNNIYDDDDDIVNNNNNSSKSSTILNGTSATKSTPEKATMSLLPLPLPENGGGGGNGSSSSSDPLKLSQKTQQEDHKPHVMKPPPPSSSSPPEEQNNGNSAGGHKEEDVSVENNDESSKKCTPTMADVGNLDRATTTDVSHNEKLATGVPVVGTLDNSTDTDDSSEDLTWCHESSKKCTPTTTTMAVTTATTTTNSIKLDPTQNPKPSVPDTTPTAMDISPSKEPGGTSTSSTTPPRAAAVAAAEEKEDAPATSSSSSSSLVAPSTGTASAASPSNYTDPFSTYFISDLGESHGAFSKIRNLKLSPRVLNSLMGVANDLIHAISILEGMMSQLQLQLQQQQDDNNNDTTTTSSSPPIISVAQLTTRCLECLSLPTTTTTTSTTQLPSLYEFIGDILHPSSSLTLSPTQKAQEDFKLTMFLTRTLLTIRRHSVRCVESSYDFEYLFQSSCKIPQLYTAIQEQEKQPMKELKIMSPRELAWNLVCAISFRQELFQQRQQQEEQEQQLQQQSRSFPIAVTGTTTTTTGNTNTSTTLTSTSTQKTLPLPLMMSRRQKLVTMAATLVLLGALPKMAQQAASASAVAALRKAKTTTTWSSKANGKLHSSKKGENSAAASVDPSQFQDAEGVQQEKVDNKEMKTVEEAEEMSPPAKKRAKTDDEQHGSLEKSATATTAVVTAAPKTLTAPTTITTTKTAAPTNSEDAMSTEEKAKVDDADDKVEMLNDDEDIVDGIVRIANRLCTFLAWASLEEGSIHAFSRTEIETQVFAITRDIGTLDMILQQPHEAPLPRPARKSPHCLFWTLLHASISRPHFLKSNLAQIVDALNADTLGRFTIPSSDSQHQEHPMMNHPHYQIPVAVAPFINYEEFLLQRPNKTQRLVAFTSQEEKKQNAREEDKGVLARVCPYVAHRPYSRNYVIAVVPKDYERINFLVGEIAEQVLSAEKVAVPHSLPTDQKKTPTSTTLDNSTIPTSTTASSTKISPTTPLLTDAMELNEWTISVVSLSIIKPSNNLLKYLLSDNGSTITAGQSTKTTNGKSSSSKKTVLRLVIAPILNRALSRLYRDIVLPTREPSGGYGYDDQPSMAPKCPISVGLDDGHVYIDGEDSDVTPDIQLCASVVGLYYHALEAILQDELSRSPPPGQQQQQQGRLLSEQNERLIRSPSFHRALLVCCYACVMKAVGSSSNNSSHNHRKRMIMAVSPKHGTVTLFSLFQTLESSPYTYLKVAEAFVRALTPSRQTLRASSSSKSSSSKSIPNSLARGGSSVLLGSPILFGLPRILQLHIENTEVQVLENIIWNRSLNSQARAKASRGKFGEPDDEHENQSFHHVIATLQSTVPANSDWPPESLVPSLPEELDNLNMTSTDGRPVFPTRLAPTSPDAIFVSYFFRKLLKYSLIRIQELCNGLGIPPSFPVVNEVWIAFRFLLRNHLDLLYDRHVDHLIICTVFGVCKILQLDPAFNFTRVIDVYISVRGRELTEPACRRTLRHVKLFSVEELDQHENAMTHAAGPSSKPAPALPRKLVGSIVEFYNLVYVPRMTRHLCKAKSILRSFTDLQLALDRQKRHAQTVPEKSKGGSAAAASLSSPNGNNGSAAESPQQEKNNRVVSPAPSTTALGSKGGNNGSNNEPGAQGVSSSSSSDGKPAAGPEFRTFLEFGGVSSLKNVTA